jgi:hypothetical protein
MSFGLDGTARGTPSWLANPETMGRMSLGLVGRPSWLARSDTTGIFFAPPVPPPDSNDLTSERPGMGVVVALARVGVTALETAAETFETTGILSSWLRSGWLWGAVCPVGAGGEPGEAAAWVVRLEAPDRGSDGCPLTPKAAVESPACP